MILDVDVYPSSVTVTNGMIFTFFVVESTSTSAILLPCGMVSDMSLLFKIKL